MEEAVKVKRDRPIIHRGVRNDQRVQSFMALVESGRGLSPEQALVVVCALRDAKRELRELRERETD